MAGVAAAWLAAPGARTFQTSGAAEAIPFDDDWFDLVLAQLVLHFVSGPEQAARELVRHGLSEDGRSALRAEIFDRLGVVVCRT